jgi:hypothetical protein
MKWMEQNLNDGEQGSRAEWAVCETAEHGEMAVSVMVDVRWLRERGYDRQDGANRGEMNVAGANEANAQPAEALQRLEGVHLVAMACLVVRGVVLGRLEGQVAVWCRNRRDEGRAWGRGVGLACHWWVDWRRILAEQCWE